MIGDRSVLFVFENPTLATLRSAHQNANAGNIFGELLDRKRRRYCNQEMLRCQGLTKEIERNDPQYARALTPSLSGQKFERILQLCDQMVEQI